MKTLNESINEVMNNGKSISTKRNELVKLGLRPNDVSFIMYTYKQTHPEAFGPSVAPFVYKFGVEVECLANRASVEHSLNTMGVSYEWAGSYYHTNGNTAFEFKRDGSIQSDRNTTFGNNPVEMVSPVLSNGRGDFDRLKMACSALESNGAQVNTSTGLHVHISSPKITDEVYVNVFKNYQMCEAAIDSFMAKSRRADNAYYAQSLKRFDFSACHNPADVRRLMGTSRYFKLNPQSWTMHKTIEARQHQGSTNYTKISNWVKFIAALVAYSVDHVISHEVNTVEEIPFLTSAQKAYFKGRAEELSRRYSEAA